jgi:uncharacterized protein (DUF58 family)
VSGLAAAAIVGMTLAVLHPALTPVVVFLLAFPIAWAVLSGVLSFVMARDLVLRVDRAPARLPALSVGHLEVTVGNRGRLRAIGVRVDGELTCGPHRLSTLAPHVVRALSPGDETRLRWGFVVRARAPLTIGPFWAAVELPGSLIRARVDLGESHACMVGPAQYVLHPEAGELLAGRRQAAGRFSTVPAATEEFIGAREYRPGDSPKLIHRVLSLRAPGYPDELYVREFEDPSADDVSVILDTEQPSSDKEELYGYRLEKAVAFAAALCRTFSARKHRVRFLCHTGPNVVREVRMRPREADLSQLDALLADVRLTGDRPAMLRLLAKETRGRGLAVVFISLREISEESLQPRLSSVSVTPNLVATLTREVIWR